MSLLPRTNTILATQKMLQTFLDNDIEVVDFLDEFRAAAGGPMPIICSNDAHCASLGAKNISGNISKTLAAL